MDEFKPVTREEYLLAKAGGIFEGEIPFSLATREEYLLNAIADRIGSSGGGAEPFVVTYQVKDSPDEGGRYPYPTICDKTFQQINEAYDAGKKIVANIIFRYQYPDESITFYGVEGKKIYFGTANIGIFTFAAPRFLATDDFSDDSNYRYHTCCVTHYPMAYPGIGVDILFDTTGSAFN